MTIHDLSPGFAKINYTFDLLTHSMILPVFPVGDLVPGEDPEVSPKVGSPVLFSAAMDDFTDLLQPAFGSGTAISTAELWSKPTADSDPIWIYTSAVGKNGTAVAQSEQLLQTVTTFRTALGGIYRLYLMEVRGSIEPNTFSVWPFGAGVERNLADWLIGDDSVVIGRDGGSLVVPIRFTSKYNDALRKKRGLV